MPGRAPQGVGSAACRRERIIVELIARIRRIIRTGTTGVPRRVGGPRYVVICIADEDDKYVVCEQYNRP
jgi:hypothetical protein